MAYGSVFLLGIVVVGLAAMELMRWMEFQFQLPAWIHPVVLPAVTVPMAIGLVRPLKAALVAQQYRHRASRIEP